MGSHTYIRDRAAPRKKQPPFLFSQVGLTAEGQAKAGYKHAYPAQLDIGSSKTRSHTVSWKQALTTPDGKEPFHHVARGVDNAGPGQVDSATDADCTEVEGDPPSTQVSPQALPRAAKASKAAMKKAAAAAALDDEPVASRTRAQKAARAGPP